MQDSYDTLKSTHDQMVIDKDKEINSHKSSIFSKDVDIYISSQLPSKLPEALSKEDIMIITKNNFQFVPAENTDKFEIRDKSGQAFKDNLGTIIPNKDTLAKFFTDKGFDKAVGRGGGDGEGETGEFASLKTRDEVLAWCVKTKVPLNEHANYLAKAKKGN